MANTILVQSPVVEGTNQNHSYWRISWTVVGQFMRLLFVLLAYDLESEVCNEKILFAYINTYKRRLTRAHTSDSQSFRCFLPFSPWRATARLRPKEQKSLENPRLSDAKQFCRSRNARRQGKGRREYFVYSQGL